MTSQLAAYKWQEAEHATVFQAINSLAARASTNWLAELPAEATRMAFPDVEWANYFTATPDAASPDKLIANLLDLRRQAAS